MLGHSKRLDIALIVIILSLSGALAWKTNDSERPQESEGEMQVQIQNPVTELRQEGFVLALPEGWEADGSRAANPTTGESLIVRIKRTDDCGSNDEPCRLLAKGKLLEAERTSVAGRCGQTDACGAITESNLISEEGVAVLDFTVRYPGRGLDDPTGFTDEYHRTIREDEFAFMFWSSQMSKERFAQVVEMLQWKKDVGTAQTADSLGMAMLKVPDPENVVWGTAVGPDGKHFDGKYFIVSAFGSKTGYTYIGYTVDLKTDEVVESIRDKDIALIGFNRILSPNDLFGIEWESCYEGPCGQTNHYFDLTTGKLRYSTVFGSILSIEAGREISTQWNPKNGCDGREPGTPVTVEGFLVDGQAVSFSKPLTIQCEENALEGSNYPQPSAFVIEEKHPNELYATAYYEKAILKIPLSPLDISKAVADTR